MEKTGRQDHFSAEKMLVTRINYFERLGLYHETVGCFEENLRKRIQKVRGHQFGVLQLKRKRVPKRLTLFLIKIYIVKISE